MKVDRQKALRGEFAGHTRYFCSEDCLQGYQQTRNATERELVGGLG
jgi:YHS domain-containing protein